MKKTIFFFLVVTFCVNAQKELWGINNQNFSQLPGLIGKYDINGENGSVVHQFTFDALGYNPVSKLLLASNGKLYGTTIFGGLTTVNIPAGRGVLFEFDPILKKYRVVHNFEGSIGNYKSNLIEPIVGTLYGGNEKKVFKFDLAIENVSYLTGQANTDINGEIIKASNGFLYCHAFDVAICPGAVYVGNINPGTIIKVNLNNNSIQQVYQLPCDNSAGIRIWDLIEVAPNKLIGIAEGGGTFEKGTLFEFNTLTNTLIKKIDFYGETMGENPVDLIDGGNGKLYGVCQNGGPAAQFWKKGTLFEYNIATNAITTLYNFGPTSGGNDPSTNQSPISLLKTSTGNLVGMLDQTTPFLYNLTTNQITQTCQTNCNVYGLQNLIEICRKPSYQEFVVNTFAPEVGTAFNYNINNDNATTFVWKKGNTVLPLQTTGNLNFANVSLSDSGVYNCTMTNECGETITANLTINVTNLSIETIEDYRTFIALYPNPSKGNINLKYPENRGVKGLKYKITNLLGQTILEHNIEQKPNMTEIAIETAGFANGVYQVTLTTDKGNWFGKFIKE